MSKSPESSIQVIDRAVSLLNALAAANGPISLKVLAAESELHPSTAHRILDALATHGFVERADNGQYRLGVKLMQYGGRVREKTDLLREARPIMDWLREQVGETVNLTVREGDEVVYVERALPRRMMRVEQLIGSRAPLHVTAVGKLFLAEGGEAECREYARRTGLPRYTPNTFTQPGKLWSDVSAALKLGYARDNEEAEQGVACVGVAIRDAHGAMIAGLSVSAPRDRLQDRWVSLVKKAGADLSARLGYTSKAA